MSDDFEDAKVFLELCYFTVSLITDTMSPVQYFKSDFVVLVQPIIEKFIAQFSSPNERQILSNASYRRLVQTYVSKFRPLIDAIKQSGLWIPQGTAPSGIDAAEIIQAVLNSETFDVEQLLLLRSVKTNQLIYSPELTLYFNACLSCCQSPIVILRLYAYSLLRSAPVIMDLKHLLQVMKHAFGIWQRGQASFEFCASLYLLLQRFSEHRPSAQDENEYEKILDMIVNLHNSSNFETLMCFDPSLRWMFSVLTPRHIIKVSETALPSLKENHYGDFCIICRCLEMGIGDAQNFDKAVKAALETVASWAHPIQKEARSSLATLPLSAPACVTPAVLDVIAEVLSKSSPASEPALYIFAQFLVSFFLGTAVPLHAPLLQALLGMLSISEGKKNLPIDIQNITIAVCSNPVRFLEVLKTTPDKRQALFSLLKQGENWNNSLISALLSPSSFVLSSDSQAKTALKTVKEKALTMEEKDGFDFYSRLHVNFPLLLSLYPTELRKLVEHMSTIVDEDLEFFMIEIFCIVALQGRNVAECKELKSQLPSPTYTCEYSDLLKTIDTALASEKTNLEQLMSHVDSSMSQFFVIGSASNTAAALLFEHIIWAENDIMLVMFKRLHLKPALWFASVVASMFTSIVADPTGSFLRLIDGKAKNSSQHLVWIGCMLFKRMLPGLQQCLVNEQYSELPKRLFYPQIEWKENPEDMELLASLNAKYSEVLKDLFSVMVPSKK